jgi:hypothetical protein
MPPRFTVAGRDVLFAHWPVDHDRLAERLPASLTPATFDGTGWVSVLALENEAVGLGSRVRRSTVFGGVPQLNLRTYVTPHAGSDDVGVYFLSLDTGRWAAAVAGRRAFGLPFHHASMRLTRSDGRTTFRSRRREASEGPAVFQARYRPTGATFQAEPGTHEAFCVEQFRYYVPATEDHRAVAGGTDGAEGGVRVGRVTHEPWTLQPVAATIRTNTLFEAAGLPTPTTEPTTHYSPGFEMGVERLETWREG